MLERRGTILSVSLVSGVALFLGAQAAGRAVTCASSFQVSELEVRWPEELKRPVQRYQLSPPTSIFRLDLNSLSRALGQGYPVAQVEQIRRVLPNRIVATLRPRHVLAQLRAGKYYPIAEEGTIVASGQPNPWPHLPILSLQELRGPFRVGDAVGGPLFWKASQLLAAIQRQGGLAGHGASSIKTRGGDLILILDSGVEVRFSADRLELGWQRLSELLAQRGDLLEEARYLDLRFEDPVISTVAAKGRRL